MAQHQVPWLQEAWRLFGIQERRGKADHPDIMALYRDVGHPGIAHDETPWCAAFVGACLERAGVTSTRSLMARSYSLWGVRSPTPRVGAVAVLTRGADPVYGHVGFWIGETAQRIFLIGGNQSNAVSVAAFDKRRLIELRWPEGQHTVDATHRDADTNARPQVQSEFEKCLPHILEMEGGYTDDPYDPGGPTNFGITLAVYARWRGIRLTASNQASLKAQLKKISPTDVAAIYRKNYWHRAHCDAFAPGLALMHFDCAVNQGVSRAVRFLQQAVDTDVDGEIGPLTLAAARQTPVLLALKRYADQRRDHYRSLHHFWRFGRGWLRRVTRTLSRAKTMAHDAQSRSSSGEAAVSDVGHPDNASRPSRQLNEKETTMPTKPMTPGKGKWWGHSMTIWGVVVTTLSTVLPTLGPAIGVDVTPDLVKDAGDQLVTTVQAISALVGTLMTIYGRARATKPLVQRAVGLHI